MKEKLSYIFLLQIIDLCAAIFYILIFQRERNLPVTWKFHFINGTRHVTLQMGGKIDWSDFNLMFCDSVI